MLSLLAKVPIFAFLQETTAFTNSDFTYKAVHTQYNESGFLSVWKEIVDIASVTS